MSEIIAKFVETIPDHLESGYIYVSNKYQTATHLCCCGCGEKVVTPIGPLDWSIKLKHGKITLYPSIGNWSLRCKSHYWIKEGKIDWSYRMSHGEINYGRKKDAKLREAYYNKPADRNRFYKKILKLFSKND